MRTSLPGVRFLALAAAASALVLGARAQTVIYVDDTAQGAGDGSSWADAYTDLQSALTAATLGEEVWVAEGVYRPTALQIPGDPRSASFVLGQWSKLYGGFLGNETSRAQRAGSFDATVLTGELQQNRRLDDNAYHVLTLWGVVVVDGFTIERGNANGPLDSAGGGIFCTRGGHGHLAELDLSNCTLRNNAALRGGGYYQSGGNVVMKRMRFLRNVATDAAGLALNATVARVFDAEFGWNVASGKGGGLLVGSTASLETVQVTNSVFHHNRAEFGGGVFMADGIFISGWGTFTNCTWTRNAAEHGGGLFTASGSSLPAAARIRNSILWDNSASLSGPELEGPNIVQLCDAPNATGVSFYTDPLFVPGTWRLSAASPCRDHGNANFLPADIADLDEDGDVSEPLPLDLGGDARILDVALDLGCEEFGPNG